MLSGTRNEINVQPRAILVWKKFFRYNIKGAEYGNNGCGVFKQGVQN